jgi:hypothetical protein
MLIAARNSQLLTRNRERAREIRLRFGRIRLRRPERDFTDHAMDLGLVPTMDVLEPRFSILSGDSHLCR